MPEPHNSHWYPVLSCAIYSESGAESMRRNVIPQPLDCCPGHKDRAFQCIINFAVQPPGNGGDQSVFGKYRSFSCIHQQETACTICILRFSWSEKQVCPNKAACWSPAAPAIGIAPPKYAGVCISVDAAGWHRFWQHALRNIQLFQDIFIPAEGVLILKSMVLDALE